jgi:hypothetical protein
MKYLKAIDATTHVDQQHEQLTLECLESMVEQVNRQYIPLTWNHDPRAVPLGRSIRSRLVELPDGEFAVETISEFWEAGDDPPFVDDGRQMPIYVPAQDHLEIVFDLSYDNPSDLVCLQDVCDSTGATLSFTGKKAQEPLSILILATTAVLGGIAGGFLSKIGEDAWDLFRKKLSDLLERKRKQGKEHLLQFVICVREDDRTLNVETILTNPGVEDIDRFMEEGLEYLEMMAPEYFASSPHLIRVVHEFGDGTMRLIYGVRKDAVPVLPVSNPKSQAS